MIATITERRKTKMTPALQTPSLPAIQRELPLARPARARLALVAWVRVELDCDEFEVFRLIADRQLVAFDLRGAGAERSFPAIWTQSVRALATRRATGCPAALEYGPEATALAIADILPPRQDRLRFSQVKTLLSVASRHVHNLLNAGLLKAVAGTGNSVWQSPQLTRESVARMLTARRML